MLKFQFKDNRLEPFWMLQKGFSIGSSTHNNLAISDNSISSSHAKIVQQGNMFLLKDLGSEQGTYVNGQRITQKSIYCGDTLAIGKVELEVVDLMKEYEGTNYWALIADSSWLAGQEFPIIGDTGQIITVGRNPSCDIVLPGAHLSRLHAEIEINDETLRIKDVESANGTYINDRKINSALAYAGDRLRFDVYTFRVFGPGLSMPTALSYTADDTPALEEGPKVWKSKPTSPGNRENIDLYKKQYSHIIVSSLVTVGIVAIAAYVSWAVFAAA